MEPSNSQLLIGDNVAPGLLARRHQMFPQLTVAEIARMHRFGTAARVGCCVGKTARTSTRPIVT